MGKRSDSSGEWEKPFWQQRGWIISAVFLLAVVVVAAVALVVRGGESEPPAQDDTAPKASPSASQGDDSQADDRPAGCKTDDSDQSVPKKSPKDMRWKAYGTTPIPVSATFGPTKYDGSVWSCYSHTPMGAVMAAHSITDHMAYPGWRDVAEKQMVAGPKRDDYIAERSTHKDTPRNAPQDGAGYAGFAVLAYSKEQATVQVLIKAGEAYASSAVSLKWVDGDWKVDPQSDGSLSSTPTEVSGTRGFVTWGK